MQYVSPGVAADWRQTRELPQSIQTLPRIFGGGPPCLKKKTLPRINSANVRYFIEFTMNLI